MNMRATRLATLLLSAVLAVSLSASLAAEAGETGGTPDLVNQALSAAARSEWSDAESYARQTGRPVAQEIVLWSRLIAGEGTWEEYTDFLARDADWPNISTIRRAGEWHMPGDLAPAAVGRYFKVALPQTGIGTMRLAEAFLRAGMADAAERAVLRAWQELPMSRSERAAIRLTYPDVVAGREVERLDMLLWNGWMREAETMLDEVSPEWQALAKARIATRRDTLGLQLLIQSVPASLRGDPGLAFERYLYRVGKGRWDDAEDYLLEKSVSAEALGRPGMWMEHREMLARLALQDGDPARAYRLAADNFGSGGEDYAEAEWFAGYLALTRMDDPARATAHFEHFRDAVSTPISLGRAGYWLGLAFERSGLPEEAAAAYRLAARHQTSFYGQLAAERAGVPIDEAIAGHGALPDWRTSPLVDSSIIRAAVLFLEAGQDGRARQFLRQAAETRPADQRAQIAQMAIDMGLTHIGVRIAKDAARDGIILPDQYYPLPEIAAGEWAVPTELALAIARQESEMNARAESPAGARGLMQLMPATAEHVAGELGLVFSESRLTRDPHYNARLGTEYLARMLRRYDGSYLLAAAAYNAGPGRVDDWIEANGDPRTKGTDVILWIESIPYSETRNYVMRVLESLHVYRARLDGRAGPIRLAADISHTG
jgi:soluble lytic murein transglycosylase